jgi:hypothetical protein
VTFLLRNLALAGAVTVAGVLGGAAACAPAGEATASGAQYATEIDKVEWLEKTAKMLRYGDGIGPHDDVAALTAMSKEDVVDLWMKDPRFGDAVLAFNLYYVGRDRDQLKSPLPGGGFAYDPTLFEFPQVLASAKAVLEGGNYFSLYEGNPPFVDQPNPALVPAAGDPPSDVERASVGLQMDQAIAQAPADRAGACDAFVQASLQATNRLRLLGFAPAVQLRQTWLTKNPSYPLTVDCSADATTSVDQLVTSMRAVRVAIDAIWKSFVARRIAQQVKWISDLPETPVAFDGLPPLVPVLGATFFTTLPSTSTNFHRKRAAYMLRTYFCDDLTPLELPQTDPGDGGTSDVHASNPTCQSCHYRLDPMGALFRDVGAKGRNFSGQGHITFDDAITFSGSAYDHYLSQWRNQDGSFRAGYWVIGRDGKPQREQDWTDADGDTLSGLWSYMRRSNVVKSCLVRKLAEYVLGPKQVYDREWLGQISESLEDGPQSAEAFKGVLKSLLLSKTFAMHDPAPGVCYDIPDGASPNRSPCAIAHIVSTQCAGCHDSADGPVDGPLRLDFTQWVDVGGGVYSWPHHDKDGNQLPRAESLRRILERITASDLSRRMPLFRALSAEDFTTFRGWLTTTLENPQP